MRLQVGKGIDEYLRQLGNLEFDAPQAVGEAVYEGAKVVADQVKKNIEALPVDDGQYKDRVTGLRSIQKEGLKRGFGIAKMKNENGYIHVKLGFDGYNKLRSKKYPKGQPNVMIARTFEGGNSFTQKIPFVAPAVRQTRAEAERKMESVIDKRVRNILG